jgi:hypothetical protein
MFSDVVVITALDEEVWTSSSVSSSFGCKRDRAAIIISTLKTRNISA